MTWVYIWLGVVALSIIIEFVIIKTALFIKIIVEFILIKVIIIEVEICHTIH